jgi:L-lactate permease
MPFQSGAATSERPELALAAIQNVAGRQANLLTPQRIVLAATVTGLLGEEARIVCAAAVPVVASVLALVLVGEGYALVRRRGALSYRLSASSL